VFFQTVIAKPVFGREPNQTVIDEAKAGLATGFGHLESTCFKDSPNHVVGSQLSLADLVLGIFLSQLFAVKFDLSPFPKIKAFYEHLGTLPSFVESHAPYFEALNSFGKQ